MDRKTILVPLDGSPESEAALDYAEAIAAVQGAGLRLLTVVDDAPQFLFTEKPEAEVDMLARQQANAQAYLDGKAAALRGPERQVSTAVVLGDPARVILDSAVAGDVEMLVLATHGRGGLQRWLVGSVADKVMRMSHRPTLLVRPPESPTARRDVKLRHLVVPLDGSPMAEEAVAPAAQLAQAAEAELWLVRVEPWLMQAVGRWGGDGIYTPDLDRLEQEAGAAVAEYLAGVQKRLPACVRSKTFVLRGLPAPELEAFLSQNNADLVVMSTHARGGLPRFVLGSTAERLVGAGFPTLLIRPTESE